MIIFAKNNTFNNKEKTDIENYVESIDNKGKDAIEVLLKEYVRNRDINIEYNGNHEYRVYQTI